MVEIVAKDRSLCRGEENSRGGDSAKNIGGQSTTYSGDRVQGEQDVAVLGGNLQHGIKMLVGTAAARGLW